MNFSSSIDFANVAIAFVAGAAAAAGTYITVRQYRRDAPLVDLVEARGSPCLSPDAEAEGYSWRFDVDLLNRRNDSHGVLNVEFRSRHRRLRRIPGAEDGWQRIRFEGAFWNAHDVRPDPLVLAPFEYRRLTGHWKQWWVSDPRADNSDYWNANPKQHDRYYAVLTDLHNQHIDYRVTYSDGSRRIFRFPSNQASALRRLMWRAQAAVSSRLRAARHLLRRAPKT